MMLCAGGCGIDHSTIALLLIALGVGAIVKYKAIRAAKCQMFGKIVGWIIMAVAVLGIICTVKCAYKAQSCHDTKMKKECHGCDDDKEKDKMKYHEGTQLPPGHPNISNMTAPASK